jgi:hypothetical protein
MRLRISASSKRRVKSPLVVGSGNALGAQPIQEGFVIAPQFNILQPHSLQQRVVSQIQDMVAFMLPQFTALPFSAIS